MTSWTATDWLMLGIFTAGAIGTVLKAQHSLITRLLAEKWKQHEDRLTNTEERLDDHETYINGIRLDVKEIQTACRIRHQQEL